MIASIPQFCQTAKYRCMINRVAFFKFIKKFLDGNSSAPAHIKLYRELRLVATSILMYYKCRMSKLC